jgi:hypothetical protein
VLFICFDFSIAVPLFEEYNYYPVKVGIRIWAASPDFSFTWMEVTWITGNAGWIYS